MNTDKADKASKKTDRLAAIEIADERTERSATDRARNIGADTDDGPGLAGTPGGDGNSIKSGDAEVPLDTGFRPD